MQAAVRRTESDYICWTWERRDHRGHQFSIEIYEQGNSWAAGHKGFIGYWIADTYAKEAERERTPDMASKKVMKRINLILFERRVARKASRHGETTSLN